MRSLGGLVMDAAAIEAIAKQVVNGGLILNWKFYLALFSITVIAGSLSSCVTSYFRSRGEHFATKADFGELLDQVRQTTETTESIKRSLSYSDWAMREFRTLRRIKLEELLNAVYETDHWLDQRKNAALFDEASVSSPDPSKRVEIIGGLYFPELKDELATCSLAFIAYQEWLIKSKEKVMLAKLGPDAAAHGVALDEAVKGFLGVYKPLSDSMSALEAKARGLMREVLGVDSSKAPEHDATKSAPQLIPEKRDTDS